MIYKLLFRSGPALVETLSYVSDWLYDFRELAEMKTHAPILEELLILYVHGAPKEIDQPFLEEKLIKIAYVLNSWGIRQSVVVMILNLLKESRFNSVKYNLKAFLNKKDEKM